MDYGVLLSTFARETAHDTPARISRQHQLYRCLRSAILSGKIEEGTRLPSTRALADELGIARNTVLYAYERLTEEGFVIGTRQGTAVARVGVRQAPAAAFGTAPALSRRAARIAQPDDGAHDRLPFQLGTPALDEFPLAQWRRCIEHAWRHARPAHLDYMPVDGNVALRRAIAEYLRVSRGVRCDASQVFVTDGTQSGFDLCARAMADAGDTVWIENPGYNRARHAFQAADLNLVPIAVDADGLAPRERDWLAHPPRLIYITPSHQYPLGAVMSLERRLSLVAQERAAGAWIIEDDYDSEFRYHGAPLPSLQGLAEDAPVIYLGTFSKVMFPGLRIGFLVAPGALAPALRRTAGALLLRGRAIEQLALAEFIEVGHFTRHLRRMRRLYAERRTALKEALDRHLGDLLTVSEGAGGMHLSARLDAPVADTDVGREARKHGLVLRPLSPFCLPGTEAAYNGLVLGYGSVAAERMNALARSIRDVLESMLAARAVR